MTQMSTVRKRVVDDLQTCAVLYGGELSNRPVEQAAKMPKARSPIIGGARKPDAKTTAAPPSRPLRSALKEPRSRCWRRLASRPRYRRMLGQLI
ncbi:MAG: hypothetical protein R2788_20250 [Saprospiraceae bacterium]